MSSNPWNTAWEPLLESLRHLKQGWPTRGWSWDARFQMCVSSFFTTHEAVAQEAAAAAFPDEWLASTLEGAPPSIRELAARTGGVRPGQRLFSSKLVEGLVAVGLWWPWGDKGTISLRAGLTGQTAGTEVETRLRQVFDLTIE